jgi:hypothetical protein
VTATAGVPPVRPSRAGSAITAAGVLVMVVAADPTDVPLGERPAPFDVVDGATVQIGVWQPGP